MKRDAKERADVWYPVWLDWLILLFTAILIFFTVVYVIEKKSEVTDDVSIEYVLCLSEKRMSLAEDNGVDTVLIPIGTSVSNANGSADLGTVVAVESHPHRILTIKDKQVIMTERNGYFDLYITVHGKASRREGEGLRMGDIRIAAGSVGDYFVGSFWAGNAKTASVRIL